MDYISVARFLTLWFIPSSISGYYLLLPPKPRVTCSLTAPTDGSYRKFRDKVHPRNSPNCKGFGMEGSRRGREEEEGLTDVQTNRTDGRTEGKRGRKSHGRRKAERTCIRSTPQHDLWEVSEEQTQHACRHSARIDDLDRHNQTG